MRFCYNNLMKHDKCTHCGKKIDPKNHDFDKDGYPICHGCWVQEEEQLEKEMR